MKILYKTSMVDKINEKIYEAKSINKEIDKIILTPYEWQDLRKELLLHYPDAVPYFPDKYFRQGGSVAEFKGIPIFVE